MNKLIAIGRLGKDPEEFSTRGETIGARFSLATDTGYGERKSTTWFSSTAFGKKAEFAMKYLRKGDKVYVEGALTQWKDDSGAYRFSLNVSELQALEVAAFRDGARMAEPGSPQQRKEPEQPTLYEEDVPF
jgi:single-strand DNA-binding protein